MSIRHNEPRTLEEWLTRLAERVRRLEAENARQAEQIIDLQARVGP